jgi:2-amino-4-hydroxy-6-hydroxymethyldihydropteridine diphosphokinase
MTRPAACHPRERPLSLGVANPYDDPIDNPAEDAWYLEGRPVLPESRKAYVALGSNLGNPAGNVILAASEMNTIPGVRVIATSRLYTTAPVGVKNQPDFVNAAAVLEVECTARELLEGLLAIEKRYGRDRQSEQRWGPRTLDLDLLLFCEQMIDEPGLTVPHPRMRERRFVLQPLADLAPTVVPPGWDMDVTRALESLGDGVRA